MDGMFGDISMSFNTGDTTAAVAALPSSEALTCLTCQLLFQSAVEQ
ncbi:hypothetical protein KIPB_013403, partial [Kipferlia bialata]|eukprot:g13403.t1